MATADIASSSEVSRTWVAAILILLWWISMGVLLPVNEAAESFDVMIWIGVHLVRLTQNK